MAICHKLLGDGPGPEYNIADFRFGCDTGGFGDVGQGLIHGNNFHVRQVARQFHGALTGLGTTHHDAQGVWQLVCGQPKLCCHQGFQAAFSAISQLRPGRPGLWHIRLIQTQLFRFLIKALFDAFFFGAVIIAGG